jgi:hypothetical protein
LKWIRVAHVCRRWREAALDYPCFWSHINFTRLTSAGMAEILARAKMAPLHPQADVSRWRVEAFERQLGAHISHTHHFSLSGCFETALARLLSSAPTLESLSLSHKSPTYGLPPATIPDNCTAPNLTSLELENCDISWKSPLLLPISISTLLRKIVRTHSLILCCPFSPGYTSVSNLTTRKVKTCD